MSDIYLWIHIHILSTERLTWIIKSYCCFWVWIHLSIELTVYKTRNEKRTKKRTHSILQSCIRFFLLSDAIFLIGKRGAFDNDLARFRYNWLRRHRAEYCWIYDEFKCYKRTCWFDKLWLYRCNNIHCDCSSLVFNWHHIYVRHANASTFRNNRRVSTTTNENTHSKSTK